MKKKTSKVAKAVDKVVKKVTKKETPFVSLTKKQRMEARRGYAK